MCLKYIEWFFMAMPQNEEDDQRKMFEAFSNASGASINDSNQVLKECNASATIFDCMVACCTFYEPADFHINTRSDPIECRTHPVQR